MARNAFNKHGGGAAPTWVFSWRQPRESLIHKGLPVLAVAGVFAFFLTVSHVRVVPPIPWAAHKATVIHVTEDGEARTLTLRAREGGPYPSRFEPSTWEGAARLEQSALAAAHWQPPPYVPELRDLPPEKVTRTVALAAKGEAFLPKLSPESVTAAVAGKLRLAPVLEPLSGISIAAMPRQLPPFTRPVDKKLTAEPWRFLVRLNPAGTVEDCVSLAGGDEAGQPPLEEWLRRVSFNPEPGRQSRWIAVGVNFTNQPVDGPDPR